jgi:hypothetical protein
MRIRFGKKHPYLWVLFIDAILPEVQECDARKVAIYSTAGYIKTPNTLNHWHFSCN